MLARNNPNPEYQPPSSFIYQSPQPQSQTHKPEPVPESQPSPPENNRGRSFRRAGNVCEIIAGSCLNSSVIFTFHLLQIHPIGFVLALGVAHLYFTATAVGEEGRRVANVMTGMSASLALLSAASEPLSEWWEASRSQKAAEAHIREIYAPSETDSFGWLGWGGVALVVMFVLFMFAARRS